VDSRQEFGRILRQEPWLARLHYLPDPRPPRWRPVKSVVAMALLTSPWILFVWMLYGWRHL
jgi:hypothetical protein